MKTLVITTIVALGIAAPALAQSQLEQSVGAEAGQYTLNQLAQLKAVESNDSVNEQTVYFGNRRINFSASDIHNARAASIFAELKAATPGSE